MQDTNATAVATERAVFFSRHLGRDVTIDFFVPANVVVSDSMHLLLVNDGQNLEELGLEDILSRLYDQELITPMICVGIHAGMERRMEYGVASQADYAGRGAAAASYTWFVLEELMPFIRSRYAVSAFASHAFAGFSLGGLSAMDISWNHPETFQKVGAFSASFWWRSMDQQDERYNDDKHRIMQQVIRNGDYKPGLRFFLQCGNLDETSDRNNNGIIDSIDDTQDVIRELERKGYQRDEDIYYLEMPSGRHDVATWSQAMPPFLTWGWGTSLNKS